MLLPRLLRGPGQQHGHPAGHFLNLPSPRHCCLLTQGPQCSGRAKDDAEAGKRCDQWVEAAPRPPTPTSANSGQRWLLLASGSQGTMWHCQLLQGQEAQETLPVPGGAECLPGRLLHPRKAARPCRKEGASVSGYLTVMQPGVCEDGLPALGQPKQAPSRLQSVKSLVPIIGGRVGEGWTPIAESSLEGQPAGRSGPLLSQPGPAATPVPQGRQDVSSPSLLLFPLAREGHFTHKPCSWCGGGGDSDACCSLSLCKD